MPNPALAHSIDEDDQVAIIAAYAQLELDNSEGIASGAVGRPNAAGGKSVLEEGNNKLATLKTFLATISTDGDPSTVDETVMYPCALRCLQLCDKLATHITTLGDGHELAECLLLQDNIRQATEQYEELCTKLAEKRTSVNHQLPQYTPEHTPENAPQALLHVQTRSKMAKSANASATEMTSNRHKLSPIISLAASLWPRFFGCMSSTSTAPSSSTNSAHITFGAPTPPSSKPLPSSTRPIAPKPSIDILVIIKEIEAELKDAETHLQFALERDEEEHLAVAREKVNKQEKLLGGLTSTKMFENARGHKDFETFRDRWDSLKEFAANLHAMLHECQAKYDERVAQKEAKAVIFTCPICLDDNSVEDRFIISSCPHVLCRGCATESIRACLDGGQTPTCPECKMSQTVPNAAVNGVITQQDAMLVLPEDLMKRFLTFQIQQARAAGLFMVCPNQNCGEGVQMEGDDVHFECPTCRFEFCTKCGVPWHNNSTCEGYQQWKAENAKGDKEFDELYKQLGSKKCPKCQNAAMKQDPSQCNKVKCGACNILFCWVCGVQIQGYEHFNTEGLPCYGKLFAISIESPSIRPRIAHNPAPQIPDV